LEESVSQPTSRRGFGKNDGAKIQKKNERRDVICGEVGWKVVEGAQDEVAEGVVAKEWEESKS